VTTRFDIAQYWSSTEGAARWPRNSVLLDIGEPSCMACGYYAREWDKPKTAKDRWNKSSLDRAHIIAASSNGPDVPSNYVLLCESCHRGAPMTSSDAVMFGWCERRKSHRQAKGDAVIAEALSLGVDPALVERLGMLSHEEMRERINIACADIGAGTHLTAMTPSTIALVIKRVVDSLTAETR
jgi:hypothetical protein